MVFQSETYSVLLVSASEAFSRSVSPLFPTSVFYPVTQVSDLREARRCSADLVVVNAPLPAGDALEYCKTLCSGSDSAILLLVPQAQSPGPLPRRKGTGSQDQNDARRLQYREQRGGKGKSAGNTFRKNSRSARGRLPHGQQKLRQNVPREQKKQPAGIPAGSLRSDPAGPFSFSLPHLSRSAPPYTRTACSRNIRAPRPP